MSLQVIIVSQGEPADDPTAGWMPEFARLGWVPVRARSSKQADYCVKSYPNAVITMVTGEDAAESSGLLGEVVKLAADRPVVAVCGGMRPVCAGSLAEAGAAFILPPGAPFALFQRLIETIREVERARLGDSGGEAARSLAGETRKLLHDVNQPLAVLQGRLEILKMKNPEGACSGEMIAHMLDQAHRISELVAQLHELHRKFK